MDLSIRDYTPADRAAVLRLATRLTTGAAPWRDPLAVEAAVTGWVRDALDAALGEDEGEDEGQDEGQDEGVWVACDSSDVVGFVHAGTRTHWTGQVDAYVGELAVADSHTGRGIGALLMGRAETWARDQGHTRLTLETGATNDSARQFYGRLGYVTEEVVLTRDLTR